MVSSLVACIAADLLYMTQIQFRLDGGVDQPHNYGKGGKFRYISQGSGFQD